MMRRLVSLFRADRGAVAIELAIAAPVLAMMLIGLIDLSTAYSNKLRLEQVAQRAVEKVQAAGFEVAYEEELEEEAADAAEDAGFTGATADVTFWLECNGTRATNWTDICTTTPVARYMQLDIQHTFAPVIATRFPSSNSDGTMTVHGIAGIRIQ